jgi:hypothetical protein
VEVIGKTDTGPEIGRKFLTELVSIDRISCIVSGESVGAEFGVLSVFPTAYAKVPNTKRLKTKRLSLVTKVGHSHSVKAGNEAGTRIVERPRVMPHQCTPLQGSLKLFKKLFGTYESGMPITDSSLSNTVISFIVSFDVVSYESPWYRFARVPPLPSYVVFGDC